MKPGITEAQGIAGFPNLADALKLVQYVSLVQERTQAFMACESQRMNAKFGCCFYVTKRVINEKRFGGIDARCMQRCKVEIRLRFVDAYQA